MQVCLCSHVDRYSGRLRKCVYFLAILGLNWIIDLAGSASVFVTGEKLLNIKRV